MVKPRRRHTPKLIVTKLRYADAISNASKELAAVLQTLVSVHRKRTAGISGLVVGVGRLPLIDKLPEACISSCQRQYASFSGLRLRFAIALISIPTRETNPNQNREACKMQFTVRLPLFSSSGAVAMHLAKVQRRTSHMPKETVCVRRHFAEAMNCRL
jgi:hypothetical protein